MPNLNGRRRGRVETIRRQMHLAGDSFRLR